MVLSIMDDSVRPSTPNTVMYNEEIKPKMSQGFRPPSGNSLAPPAPTYKSPCPDRAEDVQSVGGRIWTIDGNDDKNPEDSMSLTEDDETRILLEKEFDDYYEDHVHKSAGPVVFVSKMLGMIPVIWTEDEEESECKSYFNLYTFVIFIGWVGLATITGLRVSDVPTEKWPGTMAGANASNHLKFITRSSMDTYVACTWVASLVALLFGVFKCRSFAEVLFGLSETDAQLELQEKHYDKIKRKSLYWIAFMVLLLAGHTVAFYFLYTDSVGFDILISLSDSLAHATILVLDLQFLYLVMVLCKRYRMLNKILVHITRPWKTFRNDKPSNFVVQNILQYRFDQIFDGGVEDLGGLEKLAKKNVPLEEMIKNVEEPKVSREEENTFLIQLDILRGIHADLSALSHEVSHLLGFQILVHLITCVIFVVMFGYFFAASMMLDQFYWPYLVLCLLPAVKIFLIGHWGQCLEQQSRQPYMTICQMSTIDGSPKLERQVQKITMQMSNQCPTLKAAGYFNVGRNMILKTIGCAVLFTFFMVQFENIKMIKK